MNQNESLINLLDAIVDVKSFAETTFGVEETRPSACARCEVPAGLLGRLRIHGHGVRSRDVWGPSHAGDAAPGVFGIVLRRYRCLDCGHVMTIRPRLLARYFRYATAAIALALWFWAAAGHSASAVRQKISPLAVRGACEAHRWRSLNRWTGRTHELFGLDAPLVDTGRNLARRIAFLVAARAPPECGHSQRAFVGAQLR